MLAYYVVWVPRSHTHLRMLHNSLSESGVVKFVSIDLDWSQNLLECVIEGFHGYNNIRLVIDSDGVWNFSALISGEDVVESLERFGASMRVLYLDLVERVMPLIYTQMSEGLVPFHENLVCVTNKIIKKGELISYKSGGLSVWITKFSGNEGKSALIVKGGSPSLKFVNCYSFINSYQYLITKWTTLVVDIFKKVVKANEELEAQSLTIEGLKEITKFLADKTKKITMLESRVQQVGLNVDDKTVEWSVKKSRVERFISEVLNLDDRYNTLKKDFHYISNLWNLVHDFLQSSLDVLNIDTSRQEAVESSKLEALVSAETAQVIAVSILSIIIAQGTIPQRYQALGTIITWVILYSIISGVIKFREKKKKWNILKWLKD